MRERAPYISERTTEDLEQSLKDTRMAIACCVWDTEHKSDLQMHAKLIEQELDSRYHAALDPEEIAFQSAKEESQ